MTTLLLFVRMGWRNIRRNSRRSAITIAAMAFSLALIIFFTGFMESYMDQMEDNVIGMSLAQVQIHHPLYRSDQNIYQLVNDSQSKLLTLGDDGFAAAPRCYGYGLVAGDGTGKSAGASIKAIDLTLEPTVTHLDRKNNLVEGRFLSGAVREFTPSRLTDSPTDTFVDPLADAFDEPIITTEPEPLIVGETVLGRKMATTLGVKPGDTVSIVTMAADGTTGNELFDVVGILKNFSEIEDRSLALVALPDYRRLFKLSNDQVHEIAVLGEPSIDLELMKHRIEKLVGDEDEVATWRELQPAMAEMQNLQSSSSVLFGLIVYMGAGMLIMNSMLMMVFERIHEFGVMKAIGLKPRQLLALVFCETFWLCLIASFIGVAFGIPLTLWVGRVGIDLSPLAPGGFAFSGTVLSPVLYAKLTPWSLLMPLSTLTIIAFCSVLYPAIKAAMIEPVKAISHV